MSKPLKGFEHRPSRPSAKGAAGTPLWCPLSRFGTQKIARSEERPIVVMIAHGWRRNWRTSVIKLWCAGWLPHSRLCVRGCSYLTAGVGRFAGHKASDGHSPAVVPPPPMREM